MMRNIHILINAVSLMIILIVMTASCVEPKKTNDHNPQEGYSYTTIYEDDTIRITAKNFPPEGEFTPRLSEV